MMVYAATVQVTDETGLRGSVALSSPEVYVVCRLYNFGGAYTEVLVRAESCLNEVRQLYRMMSDPELVAVGGLLGVERWLWEAR